MNNWTTKRLDALPEGTVVAWEGAFNSWALHDTPGNLYGWLSDTGEMWSSAEIVKSRGSIRVVSVPVDALLSDETIRASHGQGDLADEIIRAAVAHVIGEQP